MLVTSDMTLTVAFVNARMTDGTLVPKGTAFFVGQLIRPAKFSMYVVTAKHVLEKISEQTAVDRVVLTMNGREGRVEKELPLSSWHYHTGRSGETVDVAVARFEFSFPDPVTAYFDRSHGIRCWMIENVLTVSVARSEHIRSGHEVGLAGLFVHHQGLSKNIPIIRVGNIAAFPEEPVRTKMGLMSAFLVEVRSVGGLSGSPVFVVRPSGQFGLIGLVHGHFDQRSSDIDGVQEDALHNEERINAGIAIVVPADRIREVVDSMSRTDVC